MHQYKTTINKDMAVQFYPKCRNSPSVVRFPIIPELAIRVETNAVSSRDINSHINSYSVLLLINNF